MFRIGYVTHFVEDEAQNAGDALASASICNEVTWLNESIYIRNLLLNCV
jgi:hypothetical protein